MSRPFGPTRGRYIQRLNYTLTYSVPSVSTCPTMAGRKGPRCYDKLSYSTSGSSGTVLYQYDRMITDDGEYRPAKIRVLVPIRRKKRQGRHKGEEYIVYRYRTRRSPIRWVMKNCHHISWKSVYGGKKEIQLDYRYEGKDQPISVLTGNVLTCPHYDGHNSWTAHSFHGVDIMRQRISFLPIEDFLASDATLLDGATETAWWDPFLPAPGSTLLENHLLELDRIALDVMVPELDTGFSLPKFIFELVELKGLWKSISNIGKDIRHFISSLGKRSVKQASDKYLESVFGWIPFVSDVQTICEKLWHLDEDISRYLANANRRQTLHFKRGLAPPVEFKDPSWFMYGTTTRKSKSYTFGPPETTQLSLVWDQKSRNVVSDYEFHSSLDFEYQIPKIIGMSVEMQKFYASLEQFGVVLSFQDFWDIVPFSFIVNWVWNLSGWFKENAQELRALPVNVVIYDYCRSIRYRLKRENNIRWVSVKYPSPATDSESLSWVTDPGLSWFTPPTVDVESEDLTSYYRRSGIPVFDKAKYPELRTPKGLTLIPATALLAQRMFR